MPKCIPLERWIVVKGVKELETEGREERKGHFVMEMGLTEHLPAGTANCEWNASRDVTLTRDWMQEWEREKEREKRIPFRCDLSCLVSVWHLGLVSPLLLGMLVPPTSPIFLVHFPISHSPDFSALTPTLTSVSAPHSNTCSLLCLFKTSPSLSFSLTSRFHYQFLCFTSFDLIFNNIFTNIFE